MPNILHDIFQYTAIYFCFIRASLAIFFVLFGGLAFCSAKSYSILSMPMQQVHTLTCAHIVNYMYFDCFCCQIDKEHKKLLN